jgi:hypothetical protein
MNHESLPSLALNGGEMMFHMRLPITRAEALRMYTVRPAYMQYCSLWPVRGRLKGGCSLKGCPSVPSMGRNLLDERSQPEPMTATVAKRKA